jgi:hypothetical protein
VSDPYTIEVPAEDRVLVLREESRVIEVPGEYRIIEVPGHDDIGRQAMTILGSKAHTAGDIRKWRVDYTQWLENTSDIEQVDVQSDSATCTVGNVSVLGPEVVFFLSGGALNERLKVSLVMTDKLGNQKTDTIAFTCVAP